MTKTIKQKVYFKASPNEIYSLLMDSRKHSEFTGSTAKISNKENGKFEAYDGYIEGQNIKLVRGKKIIQKWRGSDWPEDHYSTAEFSLKRKGEGCELSFVQKNVPDKQYAPIKQGWIDFYWNPIKEYLKSKK